MNKYIKNFIKSKTAKRVVSGLTALVMLSGITPLNEISDELSKFSISPIHVFADDTPEFTQDEDHVVSIFIDELVRYSEDCEKYREYHKNDNLRITVNAQTEVLANGFKGLGSDSFPFEGTVSIEANSSLVLFLDAPLFNAVYDDVSINATSENVLIKRGYDSGRDENYKKTPLLAKKVYHGTGTTATWKVTLSGTSTESFGGLIGTMVKDSNHGIANLSVELAMQESETPVPIKGTGNVGFICGTMMEDTTLSCTLNASSGTLRKIGGIETNSGHVGGLVGELQNGATLNYTGSVPQTDGADIKTDANGYAGGLVGKNLDGTINLYSAANTPYSSSNKYTIDQHMTGSSGAGGLYGYFEPQSAAAASIDPSVYAINCQVNGSGNTGGLIGDLVSDCAVTLSGTGTITSSHASGTASTYGGLIGQYSTSNDSSISITSMEVGTSCGGTATNYGGAVGCIPDSTNVHATFTSFTATSANAGTLTYGGLVASAKKAYIDVNGTSKITASGFKGGGLIGDLGDGVLVIDGSVDLSAATPTADEQSVGKVVGKRDNALVIKKETATLDTPSTAVDNIGSWGDVIAFDDLFTISGTSIVIKAPSDSTDHYKKITSEADYAKTALCFQIDASQNPYVSFADITYTYEDTENDKIAEQDISIVLPSGTTALNLSGKGFGGLTRDNDIGTSRDKCTYSGTFDGKNNTLNLSIGPVYRHSYIGLFAIADNATIQNVTFGSTGTINVKALADMYVGATAAKSTGAFTVKNVTVGTAFTHAGSSELVLGGIVGESDGAGTLTIGDSTGSAGNVTVNANITSSDSGSTGDVYLGGIIGRISHSDNEAVTWNFNKVNVTGTIKNSAAQTYNRVGGLVAFISNTTSGDASSANVRSLNLNTVNIQGLSIEVNASKNGVVGGLLGYAWRNVNVDFNGVNVDVNGSTPCSIENTGSATGVDFAGLVYNGTGYWKADSANDIKIDSFALSSDNAASFGMIVNKGWYTDTNKTMSDSSASAIYLELGNTGAYSLTTGATFKQKTSTSTNMTIPTFDELVAYTAYYTGSGTSKVGYKDNEDDLYIIKNGQGIVSIKTSKPNGLTMDGSTASGSYTPKTTFGQQMNPYSRYYYNLSDFRISPANDEQKLMAWGARWYAHSSIKNLFTDNSWGSTVPAPSTAPTQAEIDAGKASTVRDYDMVGYSWYPLNIDSASVSITGTFKLYNKEFEVSESAAHNANAKHSIRSSLYNSGTSQHFLMQSALFYDVNHNLTVNNVTLQGSIPQINTIRTIVVNETSTSVGDKYAGALILGKVKGTGVTDSTKSVVKLNTVTLDGIYVHNFSIFNQDGTTYADDYAPLLINKSGSYATLTVSGISNNEYPSSFSNDRCATYTDSSSNTVYCPKIATSLIGNVGNTDDSNVNIEFSNITLDGRSNNLDLTALDTAYNSKISLFTKATLLNRLSFNSGKGSYSYQWSEDWTSSQHHVTYGKEVGYTVADSPVLNQYPNMERCYADHNTAELSLIYTDPTSNAGIGTYADTFISSYLPYVAVKYTPENRYYQLEVNHATSKFGGCGTYNDPYTITSGEDFETISKILNSESPGTVSIILPLKDNDAVDFTATWHDPNFNHASFTYKSAYGDYSAGYYYNDTYASNSAGKTDKYLTPQQVRTYVAGAYFKLAPKNNSDGSTSREITISKTSTFNGFGNTDQQYAQFRGIIVGDKNQTVINETNYPLIAISNGSVVKDFDIVVGPSTGTTPITLSQDSAKSFSTNDRGKSYGAIVGIVLGGDNIIDNVSVQFQNTTITLSGDAAQLIPVGGYVGVVEKGGVIFRGMEGKTGISGIPSGVVTSGTHNGEMTAENNKRWLYVNPIIGRVINGYAVTEASAYRPYEDGTRVYHGGAHTDNSGNEVASELVTKYWDEENQTEIDTAPSTLSHVTMQNGNKNYSITDIKSAWGQTGNNNRSLTYTKNGETVNYLPNTEKLTLSSSTSVSVSNGQSFFLMSVMVNSGIAKTNLGYNQVYQVSRWAQYDDIKTDVSAAEPTTACDYYSYAQNDYLKSSDNKPYQAAGYLAKFYTTSETYAKDMANQNTTLTLTGTDYILPDGFKGVGNMYDNSNPSYYRMNISGFAGNGATISMNSSWYYYMKEVEPDDNSNYLNLFDDVYHHHSHVGFGLFNYQIGATDGSTDAKKYYNFTLTGNVITECINSESSTGAHISYIGTRADAGYEQKHYNSSGDEVAVSVDGDYMVSAGGLIGVTSSTQWLDRVALQNMYVHGLRYSGGLVGLNITGATGKFTYKNTAVDGATLDSSQIKVRGASTCGGMIGKNQQAIVDISNGDTNHMASYSITEVVSECQNMAGSDFNYGVGGFIGACRTEDKPISISYITVGAENQSSPSFVKAESADIFAGGMIGLLNKGTLTVHDCNIYNQSVTAQYIAGGLFGYYATAGGHANIYNVKVIAKDYKSNVIANPQITSTNKAAGGFFGATKDEFNSKQLNIHDSEIKGYTISANSPSECYAGGAIGLFGHNGGKSASSNTWNLYNVSIDSCTITASSTTGNAGGIVGGMSERNHTNSLYGYNILTNNLTISGKTYGEVCGKMFKPDNSATSCCVKLAGFSRQGTISTPNLVGSPRDGVTQERSKDIFYKKDGSTGTITKIDETEFSSWENKTLDVSVGEGAVSYSGQKVEYADGNIIEQSDGMTYEQLTALLNSNEVKSVDDLTDGYRSEYGFYIQTYKLTYNTNNYVSDTLSSKTLTEKTDFINGSIKHPSIWFFEKEDDYYRIKTSDNKYLKRDSDGFAYTTVSSEASNFVIFDYQVGSTGTGFRFRLNEKVDNKYYYIQTRGGGFQVKFEPYNEDNRDKNNYYFRIFYAYTASDYYVSDYSGVTFSDETPVLGTASSTVAADSTLQDYYTTYDCDSENGDELYIITETEKQNITTETYGGNSESYVIFADYNGLTSNHEESSVNKSTGYNGAAPYVTVNPKMLINSSNSSNPLFFTGDGVSAVNYADSAFKAITDDRAAGTDAKAYTFYMNGSSTEISADDIATIMANYTTSYEAYSNHTGVRGFPLLVIDNTDVDKTTAIINNYVNVLANTDYNYADTTKSAIYSVNFKRYYFNGTDFVEDRTAVASMSTTGSKFKMDPDHVDTSSTPKFTLMDVQFKDPSSPSNVAYHLYIPLYVKQLLRFEFNATVASDTNYYPSAYPAGRTWEFENYGNPVTIMLEYKYVRTPSQWAEAINSGDSVLNNYYKSLVLSNLINSSAYPSDYNTTALPPDSRLVLVDANNNDKAYYLDSVPDTGEINFYSFTSDGTSGGAHYTPAPFQNLMNIRVEACDGGTLVATANNTTTDAIVKYNGINYRRAVDGDTGLCRAFAEVAVQADNSGTLVAVSANDKVHATVYYNNNYYRPATDEELADAETAKYKMLNDVQTERYYLSIFTKESNSTNIYHATIQTAEAFAEKAATVGNATPAWEVEKWRPNNIYGSNTPIHLFYGNLFENYVDMDVSSFNGSTLMNDENQYLKVDLIANVKLSENAIGKNLASNLYNRTEGQAGVYQTFLLRYDMKDETTSNFGIVKEAGAIVVDTGGDNGYYMQQGSITKEEEGNTVIDKTLFTSTSKVSAPTYITSSSSYIEFRNNVNIVKMLGSSANNYAVAFKVKADLLYAANTLSYQFPAGNGDGTTGSLVLGYSNISGSPENAAYSTFTEKVEDSNGYRYYTKNETKAKLGYEVIETPDPDVLLDPDSPNPFIGPYGGDYSYLGINAYEIKDGQNKQYIDSYATYDLSSIYPDGSNQATDYIRLTLSLSKKGSYLSPTVDSEHAGGTALKISDFIEDITLSGVPYEGSEVLYSNEADSSVNGRTITDGENSVNVVTSQLTEKDSEATTGTMLVLIIRKDQLKRNTEGTEYYFPISYKVKTGAAANFDNSHSNMTYSNYMVSLTAAECNASGEAFNSTFATDYLIYTNAMLDPTVK